MKSKKTIAAAACALVALSVGVSGATAAAPTKSKASVITTAGSCDGTTPGKVRIANGIATLTVPKQMSWARVTASPLNTTLAGLNTLTFDSNASAPGIVWAKITTNHGSVVYSPNTQPGGESGLGTIANHDVRTNVRYNDDAGYEADLSWSNLIALHGDDQVSSVSVT